MYIGRRNVEGGGRQDDFHNSSFRGLIGSRGAIAEGWDYDVSVQFSRTRGTTRNLNYFSIPKMQRALDVVSQRRADLSIRAATADPRFDGTAIRPVCHTTRSRSAA